MKKILYLTLQQRWFDAIASGHKIEEYRDITPYWQTRIENRKYDEIHFRNGYQLDSPFMRVEYLGYSKNRCYILHLGKIFEIKNHINHE